MKYNKRNLNIQLKEMQDNIELQYMKRLVMPMEGVSIKRLTLSRW